MVKSIGNFIVSYKFVLIHFCEIVQLYCLIKILIQNKY